MSKQIQLPAGPTPEYLEWVRREDERKEEKTKKTKKAQPRGVVVIDM